VCPPFSEAISRFRHFIAVLGYSPEIIWLFREDVVERWPKTYFRIPTRNQSPLVELLYGVGVERGLGVNLDVFCFYQGRPCCYIWLPRTEEDASYRMLSGLKLSAPEQPDRRIASQVDSPLHWIFLKTLEYLRRETTWADDIPKRRTARHLRNRLG